MYHSFGSKHGNLLATLIGYSLKFLGWFLQKKHLANSHKYELKTF
jgi:hypothetical protein